MQGDIGDSALVSRLLSVHQPRAVINFAAESHVDRSIHGPGDFVQTNIVGTFHLLEAVHGYWDGLPSEAKAAFRFLHASNRVYLEQDQLNVEIMGRGYAWLDTGTHDSLLDAASFIYTLQKRQGLQVCCPEEISFGQKWIDAEQIQKLAAPRAKNGYGQYLLGLIK